MQLAYQLLETKQYPVNVVADKVGFAHASNFTLAFVKHFGVSPKAVGK
jgi:AraC-like DNA-binding protein